MHARQGTPWGSEEDRQLRESFLAGLGFSELASRHQRSRGAIRARLERLGLLDRRAGLREAVRRSPNLPATIEPAPSESAPPATASPQPGSDPDGTLVLVLERIDALVSTLSTLEERVTAGNLPDQAVRAVAGAYEELDAALLRSEHGPESGASDDSAQSEDPLPERLRSALLRLVRVCVSKRRDREIAIRTLGLMEDGAPETLATIGERWDISRERVRQCRVRAFRQIKREMQR